MSRLRRTLIFALAATALTFAFNANASAADSRAKTIPGAGCKETNFGRPSQAVCAKSRTIKAQAAAGLGCITDPLGCAEDAVGEVVEQVGNGAAAIGEQVVGGIGEQAMDGVAKWVAGGVASMMVKVQELMVKSSTPQTTKAWFKKRYQAMMLLAGALSVLALVAAAIGGMMTGQLGSTLRASFLFMPIGFIAIGAAVPISQTLVTAVDQLSLGMANTFGGDTKEITRGLVDFLTPGADTAAVAVGSTFVLLVVAVIAAIGTFLLMIELIIREGLVYIVIFYLPLGIVASVWPPAKNVARKMGIILFVIIVAKFFIVTMFAFGATMIAKMGGAGDVTGVIAGVVIMTLAAFSPMVLFSLLPFDGLGDVQGRPNTPVGAQITGSQMMRQSLTSRLGGGGKGEGEGQSSGGGSSAAKGSSGAGGGGTPGGGGGGKPPGGAGGPKPGGAPGGVSGASSGGASGGAAGGGAAAGAAAAPAAVVGAGVAVGAAAGQGINQQSAGRAAGASAPAQGGGESGSSSPGGASSGGGSSQGQPGSGGGSSEPPAHLAARQNVTRQEVSSV
ncbi:MAG: hypothetical protein JHD02_00075 [Thermoleophilaceae bacterium]|nr:hypothetical protein [Thermoleophilaceae bacterium]